MIDKLNEIGVGINLEKKSDNLKATIFNADYDR
jgi:hypothetical protein